MASACPVFRPTKAEFQDFQAYITKITSISESHGICKIIPPAGWYTPNIDDISNLDMKIEMPVSYKIQGYAKVFSTETLVMESTTMANWCLDADLQESKVGRKLRKGYVDERALEAAYWKQIGRAATQEIPVAINQPGSLFPEAAAGSEAAAGVGAAAAGGGWTLRALGGPAAAALAEKGLQAPGVSAPALCFTMLNSCFPLAGAPLDLFQVDFLHAGYGRSWYAVPAAARGKLAKFLGEKFPRGAAAAPAGAGAGAGAGAAAGAAAGEGCWNFLGHRRALVAPERLVEAGVKVTRVAQKPGELIVTFPGSASFGFAHGANAHEQRAFALQGRDWHGPGAAAPACACTPALAAARALASWVISPEAQQAAAARAQQEADALAGGGGGVPPRRFVATRVRKSKEVSTETQERRRRKLERRAQRDREEREKASGAPAFYEGVKAYLKHEGPDADTKEPIEVVVVKLKQGFVFCRTLQAWDADPETGEPRGLKLEETDPRWTRKPRFRQGCVVRLFAQAGARKQTEAMVTKILTAERRVRVAYVRPAPEEEGGGGGGGGGAEDGGEPVVEELDFDSERFVQNRARLARRKRREARRARAERRRIAPGGPGGGRARALALYWARRRRDAGQAPNPGDQAILEGREPTAEERAAVAAAAKAKGSKPLPPAAAAAAGEGEAAAPEGTEAAAPAPAAEEEEEEQEGGGEESSAALAPEAAAAQAAAPSREEARRRRRKRRRAALPPEIRAVRRKLRAQRPDLGDVRPGDRGLLNFQARDLLKFERDDKETKEWMTVLEGVRVMRAVVTSYPYQAKCRKIIAKTDNERLRSLLIQISHAGLHYSASTVRALLHALYNAVARLRPELYVDYTDPALQATRDHFMPNHELAMFLEEHITIKDGRQAVPYLLAMVDRKRGIIRPPGEPRHPEVEKGAKKKKKERPAVEVSVNGWNVVEYVRDQNFRWKSSHPRFNGKLAKILRWRRKDAVRYVRRKHLQLKARRQNIRDLVRVRNGSEAVFYVRAMKGLLRERRRKARIASGEVVPALLEKHASAEMDEDDDDLSQS